MPIWSLPPVPEEPNVRLVSWQIYEIVPQNTRHFVGLKADDHTGRVSSAIETFDARALQGTTQSGRRYTLVGKSGHHGDAQYVWDRWCRINGVENYVAVTGKVNSWDIHDNR
jgi:hypothetical protein